MFVDGVNQNWRLNFNFGKFDSRLLIAFNYQVVKIRVRVLKLGPNLSLVRIRLWSEFGIWSELSHHRFSKPDHVYCATNTVAFASFNDLPSNKIQQS